jgi:hypothetical protein
MEQAKHREIRHLYRPGDPVFFGGRGIVSGIIKAWTQSPVSHIGVISRVDNVGEGERRVHVVEATSLEGSAVVISTPLSERVSKYKGRMWVGFLDDEKRESMDKYLPDAWNWLNGHVRTRTVYDTWGAVRCTIWPQSDNDNKLFCSETVAGFWKMGEVIPDTTNPSAWSPKNCAQAKLYQPNYYQLKGRPKEIRGFNSKEIECDI